MGARVPETLQVGHFGAVIQSFPLRVGLRLLRVVIVRHKIFSWRRLGRAPQLSSNYSRALPRRSDVDSINKNAPDGGSEASAFTIFRESYIVVVFRRANIATS
jgi:hypothetical protein